MSNISTAQEGSSAYITVFPIIVFVSLLLLYNLPTVAYKAKLWYNAVLYLAICNDKSWKKQIDPGTLFESHLSAGKPVKRKTIFFIRHGESTWNDTFNKGHHRSSLQFALGFIPGIVYSVGYEWFLLLTGRLDSWFYDAPISSLGISQIDELAKFLETSNPSVTEEEKKFLSILRGDPAAPKSKVVSSCLRRAVATIAICLRERFINENDSKNSSDKEMILVLPSLQEVSRNPDTLILTPPESKIQASWIEKKHDEIVPFQKMYNQCFDTSFHKGNKPFDTNGYKRMVEFCDTVFNDKAKVKKEALPTITEDYIIVGGHSIWFRSFFRSFLPENVEHVSKTRKVVNGGVIAFELMTIDTDTNGTQYMIDPKTIKVVYGGF